MSVKRTLAAAALVGAVVAIVVVARCSGGGSSARDAPASTSSAVVAAGSGSARVRTRPVAIGTPDVPAPSTETPLESYRKANIYPPDSRPLTKESVDLLYPDRRHEQVQPTEHDDGVTYLFTADRYFVLGDQPLTVSLTVQKDGAPLPVSIVQAMTAVVDPANRAPVTVPIAFAPEGPALVAHVSPAAQGYARQTAIGVYVEFAYGPGNATHQRAHLDFQYTPSSGVPATFTGAFTSAVEQGSLVVHAGISVKAAGSYVIDCNLYDAAGAPVAWTRWKGELAAGAADAPLSFFGKVLVDSDARAPFHIGQLRGARFDPSRDPDLEQMPPFAGAYATSEYPPSAFSAAEYDSPQKQRMLQFLQDQQDKGVHQAGATRGDPGRPGDDH